MAGDTSDKMILNCSVLVYDVIKSVVSLRVCHKALGHQEEKNVTVLPSFTEHSLYIPQAPLAGRRFCVAFDKSFTLFLHLLNAKTSTCWAYGMNKTG